MLVTASQESLTPLLRYIDKGAGIAEHYVPTMYFPLVNGGRFQFLPVTVDALDTSPLWRGFNFGGGGR